MGPGSDRRCVQQRRRGHDSHRGGDSTRGPQLVDGHQLRGCGARHARVLACAHASAVRSHSQHVKRVRTGGVPYQSAYCASKFAVRGFTDSLRHELQGTGLRAITVHPGGIKTNIARSAKMHEDPRGGDRSREEVAAEFDAIARTTPERAAEGIHRGVDAGKVRILVGTDAYLFDALVRVAPARYYRVLERLELLASRLSARD